MNPLPLTSEVLIYLKTYYLPYVTPGDQRNRSVSFIDLDEQCILLC